MVDNVDATSKMTSPSTGYCTAYVTGTKAAQNDTLTVTDFRKIFCASGHVEPASGDSTPADVDIDDTTKNMMNLTASAVGTVHLTIVGIPK